MSRVNRLEVEELGVFTTDEIRRAWPVAWSGVWVGALTCLAVLLIFGLIGVGIGSHLIGPSPRILSWREFGFLALAFSIGSAFSVLRPAAGSLPRWPDARGRNPRCSTAPSPGSLWYPRSYYGRHRGPYSSRSLVWRPRGYAGLDQGSCTKDC